MASQIFAYKIPNSFLQASRLTILQSNDPSLGGHLSYWTQLLKNGQLFKNQNPTTFPIDVSTSSSLFFMSYVDPFASAVAPGNWIKHDNCLLTLTLKKRLHCGYFRKQIYTRYQVYLTTVSCRFSQCLSRTFFYFLTMFLFLLSKNICGNTGVEPCPSRLQRDALTPRALLPF